MVKSIRWTLQLWHAGLLAAVLVGFGGTSYYATSRLRYAQVDTQVMQDAQLVASGFRGPPRGGPRGDGGGGRGFGDFRGRGRGQGPGDQGTGGQGFNGGGDGMNAGDSGDAGMPQDSGAGEGMPQGGSRGGRGFGFRGGGGGGGGGPPDGGFGGPGGPGGQGPDQGPYGGGGGGNGGGPPPEFQLPATLMQHFLGNEQGSPYYILWSGDGHIMQSSPAAPTDTPDPGGRPFTGNGPPTPLPPTLRIRGDLHEAYAYGPVGARLVVGRSAMPEQNDLARLQWILCASGAGVLALGLAGGWMLSRRVVRPIDAITSAARQISASNLSRRIDVAETESELGSLATVLNDTFARLETAFAHQVRFTADASHELRTPLAVIHSHAQLALSRARTPEEYQKMFQTCLRASDRMKGLVDSLLLLARADAGRLQLNTGPVDARDIVEDCIEMLAPLAAQKNVTMARDLASAEIQADASRLAQVVTNLVTNAIRYNNDGGTIAVSLDAEEDFVTLRVRDTGIGISPEDQKELFQRFYRVDEARSREEGGSGLGLAICKTIIEAHGGTISFTSELGKGTTFIVRLPRVSAQPRRHEEAK